MSYPLSFHHYSLGQVRLGGIGGSGASWGLGGKNGTDDNSVNKEK